MADGGMMAKGGYNYGGAYTKDRNEYNKSESYEVPMSQRKMASGGKLKNYKYAPNYMINEVEIERKGKQYTIDGADVLDGIYIKKKVRFENGGDTSVPNQYLVYYKSNNPKYAQEDGFGGNPPEIFYADSTIEVMEYLKENMPSDVELLSIEELQPMETYAKGGYMADGGSIPNNYRGRKTEDIWNSLTESQRTHFMFDHFDELGIKENEVVRNASKDFKNLNESVQDAFKVHTMMGQYADGGLTDIGGTEFSQEDLSGMFMRGGMLNKKVNETLKNYLGDSSASPMHQWEVKTILQSALTDANFHQEAKRVDSIFPNAMFTESVQFSKLQEDFLRGRLEDMGRDIARMSEYDGHEIINAIAFYVSMNMGRPLGQKVESLKNTMANGGKLNTYDRGVVRKDMEKFVSIAKMSKDGKEFIERARKITNISPTTSNWFFGRYDNLDMNKASDKFVKEVKDGTFDIEEIYADGGMMANGGGISGVYEGSIRRIGGVDYLLSDSVLNNFLLSLNNNSSLRIIFVLRIIIVI
jgi:hypothetical protein